MFRRLLKTLWYRLTLPLAVRNARRRGRLIMLCYHRFEERPGTDPIPGMATTPEVFEAQIRALRHHGPILSLDDALHASGLRFVISFDDGYLDNAHTLRPLCEALRLPVTIYCTSDFVTGVMPEMPHDREHGFRAPPLRPDFLRELAANPFFTIGAHTRTHARLDRHDPVLWERELVQAKAALEACIGKPVEHFAYTYGPREAFDWKHGPAAVHAAGYRTLASNYGGRNRARALKQHPVHLHRVPAIADPHPTRFLGWVFQG